jgi:hypothetical protein
MIPLFALPCTRFVVLVSSIAAINTYLKSLHCAYHHFIRTGDERERLVAFSPVKTKSFG